MSWDADLYCPHCSSNVFDQNYTHNTNRMANVAAGITHDPDMGVAQEIVGIGGPRLDDTWWRRLNGMTGTQAKEFLGGILADFDARPMTYRAMNPDNGWGDFDSFRDVLRRMRDKSADAPDAVWETSG